jgi:hypothetical protein
MLESTQLFRVRNWNKHYENNRSRCLQKLGWFPMPNRLDNDGYIELVMHPSGPAHLGAWVAILQTASRCRPRGVLIRDNLAPHTPESLSRITRLPPDVISDSMGRLVAIGWLEIVEISQALAEIRQDDAGIRQGDAINTSTKEGKKERRKEGTHGAAISEFLDSSRIPKGF